MEEFNVDISSMNFKNIHINTEQVNSMIARSLENIASLVEIDHIFILEHDFDRNDLLCHYEWCKSNVHSFSNNSTEYLKIFSQPMFKEQHVIGNDVIIDSVTSLKNNDIALMNMLDEKLICSIATFTIFSNDTICGFLVCESTSSKHIFKNDDQILVKLHVEMYRTLMNRENARSVLNNVFNNSSVPMVIKCKYSNQVFEVNTAMIKLFGSKEEDNDFYSKYWFEKLMIEYQPTGIKTKRFIAEMTQKLVEEGFVLFELECLNVKRENIFVEIYASIIKYNNREAILCTMRDISDQKRITAELIESKNYFDIASTAANLTVWRRDLINDVMYFDEKFVEVFDSDKIVTGAADFHIQNDHPDDLDEHMKVFDAYINGDIENYGYEHRLKTRTGDYKWVYCTGVISERCIDGTPKTVIGIVMDINDVKSEKEKLLKESAFDHITSLYNARSLKAYMNELEKQKDIKIDVIYGDIVGFRIINDLYGYDFGDEYLRQTAKAIKNAFSEDTRIFKMSADEFVAVCINKKTHMKYDKFIDQMNEKKIPSFKINVMDRELDVKFKCGIASYPADTDDLKELPNLALTTLKLSKINPRDVSSIFNSELFEKLEYEKNIVSEFSSANLEKEFVMYYQPIIDLKTEKIMKMEALVRWEHPTRGLLTPYYFIDILEKSYQLIILTPILFRKVLKHYKTWQSNLEVSFNIPPSVLSEGGSIEALIKIAEEENVNTQNIHLEFIEGMFDSNNDIVLGNIGKARRAGFKIAIDDFGIAYSTLARLSDIRFDVVKIDKKFAETIDQRITQIIITMINDIAAERGSISILEGVETYEQLILAKKLGINYIQGYYFYKPASFVKTTEILDSI